MQRLKRCLWLGMIGVVGGLGLSVVVVRAAASYPGAVKSFTTKTDGPGQTIFAAHINDLQDEIVAIEQSIINGPFVIKGRSYSWPSGAGAAGTVLTNNGSDTLTWAAATLPALTAHGILLGQGASAVTATAAMTTGQLLVGSTGADPVPTAAATAGASMVLLKSGSGTSTAAGATNVDTIALTGLTAADMLYVKVVAISATQATANIGLYNNTDSTALNTSVASLAAGATLMLTFDVSQSQASATSIDTFGQGKDTVPTVYGSIVVAGVTTAWTGAWTLALRHGGVTAGGTLQWRWSVYKLSGQ